MSTVTLTAADVFCFYIENHHRKEKSHDHHVLFFVYIESVFYKDRIEC